jgi:hypothetical protein
MKFKQFLNRKEITRCYCSQLKTGLKPKMAHRPARAKARSARQASSIFWAGKAFSHLGRAGRSARC